MKTQKVLDLWRGRVKEEPLSIEHFRIPSPVNYRGYDHIAVFVRSNGDCYVGKALLSSKDNYNRKLGYVISVGRAFKRFSSNSFMADFYIDDSLRGFPLRDSVAERVLPQISDFIPQGERPLLDIVNEFSINEFSRGIRELPDLEGVDLYDQKGEEHGTK